MKELTRRVRNIPHWFSLHAYWLGIISESQYNRGPGYWSKSGHYEP